VSSVKKENSYLNPLIFVLFSLGTVIWGIYFIIPDSSEYVKNLKKGQGKVFNQRDFLINKAHGSKWDATENVLIDEKGITILLDTVYFTNTIEATLANTVEYSLEYYRGNDPVASMHLKKYPLPSQENGLFQHRIGAPNPVRTQGFNKIHIQSINGTGSIGHIHIQ